MPEKWTIGTLRERKPQVEVWHRGKPKPATIDFDSWKTVAANQLVSLEWWKYGSPRKCEFTWEAIVDALNGEAYLIVD